MLSDLQVCLTNFFALRQITNKPILLLSGVHSREELQQALDLNCHCVVHHSSQITLINSIHFIGGCYGNSMSNWVTFTVYYDQIYLVLTSSSLLFGYAPFSTGKLHGVICKCNDNMIFKVYLIIAISPFNLSACICLHLFLFL
jgi:hypothetical protein